MFNIYCAVARQVSQGVSAQINDCPIDFPSFHDMHFFCSVFHQRVLLDDAMASMPTIGIGLSVLWAALQFSPNKYFGVVVVAWCAGSAQLLQRGVIVPANLSEQYMDGAHFHRSVACLVIISLNVITYLPLRRRTRPI